jgi:hypothetical protein
LSAICPRKPCGVFKRISQLGLLIASEFFFPDQKSGARNRMPVIGGIPLQIENNGYKMQG